MSPEILPCFVGVDVGGTNVKLGVVSDDGTVLGATSFPTEQSRGPEFAFANARQALGKLLQEKEIHRDSLVAAGLGTPGPLDAKKGLILEPVNLPGWRNFPVRDSLSKALDLPVYYTNDANAAAFGEYWAGSGKQFSSIVFFTLGTGVGGGIIVDDHAIEGVHSLGAELGHITVDTSPSARVCSCGMRGHLEAYSSANAIVSRCREGLVENRTSPLCELGPEQLSPLAIAGAAESGDEFALSLIMETADWMARGIAMAAHFIDAEATMIGGAMTFGGRESPLGRKFLERMRQKTAEMVFPELARDLKIEFASLGGDSGFIGAAGIARVRHPRTARLEN